MGIVNHHNLIVYVLRTSVGVRGRSMVRFVLYLGLGNFRVRVETEVRVRVIASVNTNPTP